MKSPSFPLRATASHPAFSTIELLLAIAVVAVLIVALTTGARQMMQSSRQGKNVHQLRQLGTAMQTYAADHGGRLPPNRRDGKNLNPAFGVNLSSGAAPRQLFSRFNPRWDGVGQGEADYLESPDLLYSPLAALFRSRPKGEFYRSAAGGVIIGYFYYYSPRDNPIGGFEEFLSERIQDGRLVPLFSDVYGSYIESFEFEGSHCAVLYTDGSVRSIPQSTLAGLKDNMAVIRYLLTH